jgi:hypothetical protein
MKLLKKNATYDDLREVSDHFVAEMLTGDLYAFPRPALPHARASSVLGAALTGPFDQGRNGPRRLADPGRAGAPLRPRRARAGPRGLAP